MNIFFTSDTHIGHENIIRYCDRPFANVFEMNEKLIENWNSRVKPGDVVYHLGDFALVHKDLVRGYVRRLNGQIHLIAGNHDRFLKNKGMDFGFAWTGDYKRIEVGDQKIALFHYPIVSWHGIHRGTWHLHGHTHGNLKTDKTSLRMDVGVDPNGYAPVSFDEVVAVMKKREFVPVDHHDL